jgi:hypothetical protein
MSILYLTWVASVENGSIEWRLIDRENLQLSVVYILQCQETGKVKIGITQHFNQRLKDIQATSPTKLKLVVRFPTIGQGLESFLHNHFKEHRLHGEWFLIPWGMDGLLSDLRNKAIELSSQSILEKEKIFQLELSHCDCPF